MHRILLPIDTNEERAEKCARFIASLPQAADTVSVHILNVFKEIEGPGESTMGADSEDLFDESAIPQSVEVAETHLQENGIAVTVERVHGDPAEEILNKANEGDIDQIVMSGRKRSLVGKVLFGSVTQAVLLSTDKPITVM